MALPIAWMALIFALSSVPGKRVPVPRRWDKVAHGVEYAVLGFLAHRALRATGMAPSRAFAIAVVGSAAFGVSDEWHQSFVPMRSVEAADAIADACGGLAGAGLAFLAERRAGSRSRRPEA